MKVENWAPKRDQLMVRKLDVDGKLAEARIALEEAEALAAAEGKYLPPREHAAMKRNVSFLGRESQRLQFELRGDRKPIHEDKDKKAHMFMQEFFMLARRRLEPEVFKSMCQETEKRLSEQFTKDERA